MGPQKTDTDHIVAEHEEARQGKYSNSGSSYYLRVCNIQILAFTVRLDDQRREKCLGLRGFDSLFMYNTRISVASSALSYLFIYFSHYIWFVLFFSSRRMCKRIHITFNCTYTILYMVVVEAMKTKRIKLL
jgi:hypothetical protein